MNYNESALRMCHYSHATVLVSRAHANVEGLCDSKNCISATHGTTDGIEMPTKARATTKSWKKNRDWERETTTTRISFPTIGNASFQQITWFVLYLLSCNALVSTSLLFQKINREKYTQKAHTHTHMRWIKSRNWNCAHSDIYIYR